VQFDISQSSPPAAISGAHSHTHTLTRLEPYTTYVLEVQPGEDAHAGDPPAAARGGGGGRRARSRSTATSSNDVVMCHTRERRTFPFPLSCRISMETAAMGGMVGFHYIAPNHIIKTTPMH